MTKYQRALDYVRSDDETQELIESIFKQLTLSAYTNQQILIILDEIKKKVKTIPISKASPL